jgi:hypothetical protein
MRPRLDDNVSQRGINMENIAHRQHAIRDRIVDREIRRLELIQRAQREAAAALRPPATPDTRPGAR